MENQKLTIGYLHNPDVVVYSTLDNKFIKTMIDLNIEVVELRLEQIFFDFTTSKKGELYKEKTPIKIDGFLAYGGMSDFHYQALTYINRSLTTMGVVTLHSPEHEVILNDKYLQLLKFVKNGVPIPDTSMGYCVDSFKAMGNDFFPEYSIMKKLSDYGGDGITKHPNKEHLVNSASKNLWRNEYCIFQEFIKDVPGKSVRVLLIGGKTVAVAEYQDISGDFKSNANHSLEYFTLVSLMESEKFESYKQLAEKAVNSIGDLTVAGVDILDSKERGMLVIEVNMWPDIMELAFALKIDTMGILLNEFFDKIRKAKLTK